MVNIASAITQAIADAAGSSGYVVSVVTGDREEDIPVGGFFPTMRKPRVIFRENVELRLSDLPRWRPHIRSLVRFMEEDDA
jgi:hypothetical protein